MPNWLNQEIIYTYSVPLFVLVIGIELIYSNLRGLRLYSLKDSLTSATFALSNLGLDMLFKGVSFAVLGWCFVHRAVDWSAQGVWYWLLLVILQDLAYWTQHTVDHSSRLFWAIHSTHHNSNEYNLTTGFRSSVLQPLYRYVYFMPLAWLGFHPLHIMFVYVVTQIYGNLVHTQTIGKLGWVEKVLVTPSHHRVHHGCGEKQIDCNYAGVFIIWDRLFGTFVDERDAGVIEYGVKSRPVRTNNVFVMIFEELADLIKTIWRNKDIRYLWHHPDWSPSELRKK